MTEPPGGEARAAQTCEQRRRGFQAVARARLPGPVHSKRITDIEGNELVLATAGGEGQRVEDVVAVTAAVLGGRSQEQTLLPLGQAAPWFGRVVGE